MAVGNILFPLKSRTYIDNVRVDLLEDSNEQHPAEITNYPIEDGATISDNVTNKPLTLRIRGTITDTSFEDGAFRGTSNFIFNDSPGSSVSRNGYNALLALRESKETFSIMTKRRIFEDMLFGNFTVRDSKKTGLALDFIAECQQIKKASPRTIKIPKSKISAKPANAKDQQQSKVDNGSQGTVNKDNANKTKALITAQGLGFLRD